jgi:ATP synthase regulation protein NCA2
MKTDLEAAMIELDNILHANELTMAVTAALPAMFVAAFLVWAGWRLLSPPPPNMRTTAGPVRVAMAELEQARSQLCSDLSHLVCLQLR